MALVEGNDGVFYYIPRADAAKAPPQPATPAPATPAPIVTATALRKAVTITAPLPVLKKRGP